MRPAARALPPRARRAQLTAAAGIMDSCTDAVTLRKLDAGSASGAPTAVMGTTAVAIPADSEEAAATSMVDTESAKKELHQIVLSLVRAARSPRPQHARARARSSVETPQLRSERGIPC